jgi:hypothetical protein
MTDFGEELERRHGYKRWLHLHNEPTMTWVHRLRAARQK